MSAPLRRAVLLSAVSLALVATVVAGRVAFHGSSELRTADAFRSDGDRFRAIEHYRRALRWRFPGSSTTERATAALAELAREAEESGDLEDALLAWRSLVGSLSAARFAFSGPHPASQEAKEEIARLMAASRAPAIDAKLEPAQLAADHRRLLDRVPSADPLWGSLLVLGFGLWVASLFVLAIRGFDSNGRLRRPVPRAPALGAAAGLASFVLGLLFA